MQGMLASFELREYTMIATTIITTITTTGVAAGRLLAGMG